jgi:hypothetical protein
MKLHVISDEKMKLKRMVKDVRDSPLKLNLEGSDKKTFETGLELDKILNKSPTDESEPNKKRDHNLHRLKGQEMMEKFKEENFIIEKITLKSVEEFLSKRVKIDDETNEFVAHIKSYEKVEDELKKQLEQMKRSEMDRLFKEFMKNDYERRYNTTRNIVISALIGEENMVNELSRQMRVSKV